MCSVPETSRTSFSPAPTIFRNGWNTIGDGPTGSRCLLVTLVSSPSRVPLPPARITPRFTVMVGPRSLVSQAACALAILPTPRAASRCQPAAVLLLVVAQVVAGADLAHPRL